MSQAYNDALREQLRENLVKRVKEETLNMPPLQQATLVADVLGFFDPTPTCDLTAMTLSLIQGDLWGAGASALGAAVPYLGDIAKIGKIAEVAPKTAEALGKIAKAGDELASPSKETLQQMGLKLEQVAAARAKALEKVQKDLLDAKFGGRPGCVKCTQGDKVVEREMHMPSGKEKMPSGKQGNGKWNTADGGQPSDGNGVFTFSEEKILPNGDKVTEIKFKNGAPDFDPYVEGGKHDLWVVKGTAKTDANELALMMREKDPAWMPPPKKDFVLHHFEDGKVGYVPRVIHDGGDKFSGVAHTSGNSMINNDTF
ncbi:MAG: hypothetical protein ACK5TK_09885 [Betaproteobacteria bacterium]